MRRSPTFFIARSASCCSLGITLLSASVAMAQYNPPDGSPVNPAAVPQYEIAANGLLAPAGFSRRGEVLVYAPSGPMTSSVSVNAFNGISLVGDDVNFQPGPWAAARGQLTRISVPIRRVAGTFPTNNCDLVVSFYDAVNFAGVPMTVGQPFARVASEDLGLQIIQLPVNSTFVFNMPLQNISVPGDEEIFVTVAWHAALTGTGNAGDGPLLPGPTLTPPSTITALHPFRFWGYTFVTATDAGSTTDSISMDWNSDGVLTGGPLLSVLSPGHFVNGATSNNEHRTLSSAPRLAISLFGTPQITCDNIDFNGNGIFPEDQDVVDFFDVLAGGACVACNDIDFNNNGVFPEDQDVVDFFNVLAGGACP